MSYLILYFLDYFISTGKFIRFGGALDESARQFSNAYDKGKTPLEFVNEMRNSHKYIQVGSHVLSHVFSHVFSHVIRHVLSHVLRHVLAVTSKR